MSLYRELFGETMPRCIALVGAGGKTTCIEALAEELSPNARVIITTTTKMHPPADRSLFCESVAAAETRLRDMPVVWAGTYYNEYKMQGLPGALPDLCALADYVLIEADGARKHPLKMTDPSYEPQIPPEARAVVAVAGMDGIGQPLELAVHRPQLAAEALHLPLSHIITPADVAALLRHCYRPDAVLLNKADDQTKRTAAETVARELKGIRCVITSLRAARG